MQSNNNTNIEYNCFLSVIYNIIFLLHNIKLKIICIMNNTFFISVE